MEEQNCPECGNEIYRPYKYCNACSWEKKEEEEGKPAAKKESKKKLKKEEEEKKEPTKITCKCGTKFKVKSTKRPLKFKCPKCGRTGVLKSPEKPGEPTKKKKEVESDFEKPDRSEHPDRPERPSQRPSKFEEKGKRKGKPKHTKEDKERLRKRDRFKAKGDRKGPEECPECGSRMGITGTCPNCGFRSKSRKRDKGDSDKRERIKSKREPPKDAHVVKPRKGICSSCGSKDLRFFDDGSGSCPNCGHEFTWDTSGPRIQQEEYYCDRCREPLEYIDEYERWYCYNCEEYF